jgi:hypothetical protein
MYSVKYLTKSGIRKTRVKDVDLEVSESLKDAEKESQLARYCW